jgi:hypothetical protein
MEKVSRSYWLIASIISLTARSRPTKNRSRDNVMANVEFGDLWYRGQCPDVAIREAVAGSHDQTNGRRVNGRFADAFSFHRGFFLAPSPWAARELKVSSAYSAVHSSTC